MSTEYIWINDVKKSPAKILAFFEKTKEKRGAIEKIHIDICCFDFKNSKDYCIYIYPSREKKKDSMEIVVSGDNMCLKLGNDGAIAPQIANMIFGIFSPKYKCVGETRTVDGADKRRYYSTMKKTPIEFPIPSVQK